MQKRGKDLNKFKEVVLKLIIGETLERKYNDHLLTGNFANRRECHLEPDWLLIYRFDAQQIIFERTGKRIRIYLSSVSIDII